MKVSSYPVPLRHIISRSPRYGFMLSEMLRDKGVCAVVYAVVHQQEKVTQGLVCAKSRIAKRNL